MKVSVPVYFLSLVIESTCMATKMESLNMPAARCSAGKDSHCISGASPANPGKACGTGTSGKAEQKKNRYRHRLRNGRFYPGMPEGRDNLSRGPFLISIPPGHFPDVDSIHSLLFFFENFPPVGGRYSSKGICSRRKSLLCSSSWG